jgi:hypothetical protein
MCPQKMAICVVKKMHSAVISGNYEQVRAYPHCAYVVHCRGGQRFEYSPELITQLYEVMKP